MAFSFKKLDSKIFTGLTAHTFNNYFSFYYYFLPKYADYFFAMNKCVSLANFTGNYVLLFIMFNKQIPCEFNENLELHWTREYHLKRRKKNPLSIYPMDCLNVSGIRKLSVWKAL